MNCPAYGLESVDESFRTIVLNEILSLARQGNSPQQIASRIVSRRVSERTVRDICKQSGIIPNGW